MLFGVAFFILHSSFFIPVCRAQTDSLKNQFSVGLNYLAHGELCAGGLPRYGKGHILAEDCSSFLFGRTRLITDYERPGLHAHAVIQNKA